MRSKTSFFNGTLYKKNLLRFWPLWGLASFAGALVPMTTLLQMARSPQLHWDALDIETAYYAVLTAVVPVVSLVYAVLCAAAVWSYLYNPRSTGMMHRLPIRREGLFLTGFLSGMTMMLIPYVITGALTILMTAFMGVIAPTALLHTILGVLGESFFYFSSATFVAFLTGNVFAMPVLYFLLHFLQPLVMFLLRALQSGFYFGVPGSYTSTAEWLCPTVYLINNVELNHVYENSQEWDGWQMVGVRELASVELERFWLIAVYAGAGVVLLALAWLLYRKRNSEGAGDVAAVGWMRPVYRYGGALLAGVAGGMLLYALVWQPFQNYREQYEALPLLICMVIMGLIGYYGVSMLLEKSLRVFRGSAVGAILAVALLAAICGVVRFDLFGIEHQVPARSEIETVDLYVDGEQYQLTAGKQDEMIDQLLDLHQAIVDDLDYIRTAGERENAGQAVSYVHMDIEYHLTDGRSLHRIYGLSVWEDRMEQEGTFDRKLAELVDSPEAKLLRLGVYDEELQIGGGALNSNTSNTHVELTPTQATAIRDAVARDAANGSWGGIQWFEETRGEEFASVDIWRSRSLSDGQWKPASDLYLILRPEMSETIACLQKLGMLTADLKVIPQDIELPDTEPVFTVDGEQQIDQSEVAEITGAVVGG